MSIIFKEPMLACPLLSSDVEHTDDNILSAMLSLRYPVMATLKLDGVRALRLSGSLLSRKLKKIPNRKIRDRAIPIPGGFDMELYSDILTYNQIQSIVMSQEHDDSDMIQFHVLDWYISDTMYGLRIRRAYEESHKLTGVICEYPSLCNNADELMEHFLRFESEKGEGICFRLVNSPYKFGRSTLSQQWLVKLCRYHTDEATVLDFVEQQENCNKAKWGKTGKMDRSSHASLMVGKGVLGALLVRNTKDQVFTIGTGFTNKQRRMIWDSRASFVGKTITYSYKLHGVKTLPRCPAFKGFRNINID
jgi:DNA ligase 1